MFKLVLFFLTIALYAQAQNGLIAKRREAVTACLAENPNDNKNNTAVNRACVTKCVSEKLGFSDASGNPVESNYDGRELEFVKTCNANTKNEPNGCRRVAAFERCLEEERMKQRDAFNKECAESSEFSRAGEDLSCFHRCVAIKEGVLMDDGEVDTGSLRKRFGDETAVGDNLRKCKEAFIASIGCQKSMDVLYCVLESSY